MEVCPSDRFSTLETTISPSKWTRKKSRHSSSDQESWLSLQSHLLLLAPLGLSQSLDLTLFTMRADEDKGCYAHAQTMAPIVLGEFCELSICNLSSVLTQAQFLGMPPGLSEIGLSHKEAQLIAGRSIIQAVKEENLCLYDS